jgi:hypothetical protein
MTAPTRALRCFPPATRPVLTALLALAALIGSGCEGGDEQDPPDVAARKAECRKLEEHIVQITPRRGGGPPETDPAKIQQIVAQLPVEDFEQCAAVLKDCKPGAPCVIDCLKRATDPASLRSCIAAKPE